MLRFMDAGLIAGMHQLMAVTLISSVAFLMAAEKIVFEPPSEFSSEPRIFSVWLCAPILGVPPDCCWFGMYSRSHSYPHC